MRTIEEVEMIKAFIEANAKTWFKSPARQWVCRVSLWSQIEEMGLTKEMAMDRMAEKIGRSDFLMSFIKQKSATV